MLKKDQLNLVMLAYLRTILYESFFETSEPNSLPISEISNMSYELHVLEFYLSILKYLETKF